ncbi:MAG: acyl carrier protein [Planctomycetes bacterium]|jgi:acyl carrier protein|nr:acyl carrier protein [Planctomycetota bacterium]
MEKLVEKEVAVIIKKFLTRKKKTKRDVKQDYLIVDDLGLDSLEVIELEMVIEDRFPKVSFGSAREESEIFTVRDLSQFVWASINDPQYWRIYLAKRQLPVSAFVQPHSLDFSAMTKSLISGGTDR